MLRYFKDDLKIFEDIKLQSSIFHPPHPVLIFLRQALDISALGPVWSACRGHILAPAAFLGRSLASTSPFEYFAQHLHHRKFSAHHVVSSPSRFLGLKVINQSFQC